MSDSLPPTEKLLLAVLQAQTSAVNDLVGSVRELIGAVKADRAARADADARADARAAVPHPVSAAASELLRSIATNPRAVLLLAGAVALMLVCGALLLLSGVDAAPSSALFQLFSIVDHHLPGGSYVPAVP